MTARGHTKPLFIDLGAKINARYYIDKVLPHYIAEMKRLYPEGGFHQDSAPSHVAKATLKFMVDSQIDFIPPQNWLSNSPDAAPCDFFLWGYLKNELRKRKASTIETLKKAIREEVAKIPLDYIKNALRSWPTRVLKNYKANGGNIERF